MTSKSAMSCFAAVLATACSRREVVPQPPPAVRVERVELSAAAAEPPRYSGVALPTSQVAVAFRVPGYVAQIRTVRGSDGRMRGLAEGNRVRRGEVLVKLRDTEYRDKLAQASGQRAAVRAVAERARIDFDRATRLFATRSITKPEYDGARAQLDASDAQLAVAEATLHESSVALGDTMLASPLDGDVVKKAVEPGSFVGPGSTAFVVADPSTVKVVIGVPDVVLHSLALGRVASVTSDALPRQRFQAAISRIASAANPATRNFDVEIAIPNPRRTFKLGMVVEVELLAEPSGAGLPLLPFSAIVEPGNRERGFAVVVVKGDEGTAFAHLRRVDLGEVVGNRVTVARGLSRGDCVVTTGASLLSDGERVEVVP